jgi:hypothetical protein
MDNAAPAGVVHSAAAIVTYFVLPTAFTHRRPVVRFSQLFLNHTSMSDRQWVQLGTGTTLWVILPFVLGLLRCCGPRSSDITGAAELRRQLTGLP